MLTQPSDEIRARNTLRGMHGAVLLQDAVMSYSSFPYARWLSPNKLHEYKQFYLQFFFCLHFLSIFQWWLLTALRVLLQHSQDIARFRAKKSLYKYWYRDLLRVCNVSVYENYHVALVWKNKEWEAFSLLYICVYFIENLTSTLISLSFYSEAVTPKLEVLCFSGGKINSALNFLCSDWTRKNQNEKELIFHERCTPGVVLPYKFSAGKSVL